jgi:FtsH-binding integral membrane protein
MFPDKYQPQATTYSQSAVIDAGLQAHMRSVYNTMCFGLVVTGLVAFSVANIEPVFNLVFGTPLRWVALFAPLAFLMFGFTPGRLHRMPADKIRLMFYGFSALMGLSMAAIFMVFTGASIARVFFVTAGAFAATSLYGYTTKRDLARMGSFLFMGLIGIVLASVVNIFLGSAPVQFAISVLGIVIFTGLAAWETQRLKESYSYGSTSGESNAKMAVMGALSLYLNFINLFQTMMHFMGNQR